MFSKLLATVLHGRQGVLLGIKRLAFTLARHSPAVTVAGLFLAED
jgi:hypothetical protein